MINLKLYESLFFFFKLSNYY